MAPRKKAEEPAAFPEPTGYLDEDVPMGPVAEEEDRFGDSLEDAVIGQYEAGIPEPVSEIEEI